MMMYSNIFIVLPVAFAAAYQQWIYLFLAAGICIFSPLYHWHKLHKKRSRAYRIYRDLDIFFTTCGIVYMYYFSYQYAPAEYQPLLFALLSMLVVFFWYGRTRDYKHYHPWFHIMGAVVSCTVLVLAH